MEELFYHQNKGEPPHRRPQSQYDFSNYTLLRAIRYFVQYAATQLRLFHIRLPLFNIAHLYFKKLRNLFKWNIIL